MCGSFAGFFCWLSAFPLDVIKTKIQVDNITSPKYDEKSLIGNVKKMYSEFGFKGFYRGLSICLVRSIPVGGMGFVVYEYA